ncbi:valine-trna ligase [Ceraceosorus bombacis]|uniref:Valine--tRNA ligase, mitochondrial n=1 Tax=Ceraceosorus bombacis TaxID=401625 RepID=A0A0P1BF17_9BASI|nr:valine-trna ligase [Ceraceosorus bombacis]
MSDKVQPPAGEHAAAASPAAAGAPPVDPQDGDKPMTKSAMKKAAKEAERLAKSAAKQAVRAANNPAAAAGAAAGEGKKAKAKKEKAVEEEWVNNTKSGERKDLSGPMESGYNPSHVEESWYEWWENSGFFKPAEPSESDPHDPNKTFVIPAPPPNVTGALHIGHALTISIQDTLIRWYRMRGWRVLFNPGYDHASISTQAVVEKRLLKLEGKTRHQYGREEFLRRVYDWSQDYKGRIGGQTRRLGASYDYSREAFTMDETRSKAVVEAFCKLHEEGIIYRASRLVNWCCKLNTTLSTLEVDQKQLSGRTLLNIPGYDEKERIEFGVIVSFAYEVADSPTGERLVVATTRPETMLGDSAVAVHPKDARYTHLHGKHLLHPFLPYRRIPVVTDEIAVDMEFGTGAVKITPAHDPNDYEVGKRHNLEFINILNDDGTLNHNAGEFAGVKRFTARRTVVEALKAKGLYVETKDNPMSVPVCSRSGDIVEPLIKPQWWVSCKPLADEAVKAVEEQKMTIVPDTSKREFFRWMDIIQDWCISRQLWWGHRCPAYFVDIEGKDQNQDDSSQWVVGRNLAEAEERARKLAGPDARFTLKQDEDVLDTWFSSGLWPFSIMGWPEQTPDLRHFYPNSMLETGWDILFFWVARMVMLGVHFTGKIPFQEVFCHAMVRDAHGRKMSKSLGNVIDPIDVIQGAPLQALHDQLRQGNLDEKEILKAQAGQKKDFPKGIPQCGTDALRFALCAYTAAGRDINLEIARVEGYRKFCNKLWNATRFALLKLEGGFQPAHDEHVSGKESLAEKWILHKLDEAAKEVNSALEQRNFMSATSAVYNFWLYELCDVYIEAIKPITDPSAEDASARASAQETLYTALESGLRLLHPFMPFVTEELWQRLPRRQSHVVPSISLAAFPEAQKVRNNSADAQSFESVMAAVRGIRALAADYGLAKGIEAYVEATSAHAYEVFKSQEAILTTLIKGCDSVKAASPSNKAETIPEGCAVQSLPSASCNVHVLIKGKVDIEAELSKLVAKMELNTSSLDKVQAQTENKEVWEKTPEDVRKGALEKLQHLKSERETLEGAKATFEKLKD